jgi:hypothetical protein
MSSAKADEKVVQEKQVIPVTPVNVPSFDIIDFIKNNWIIIVIVIAAILYLKSNYEHKEISLNLSNVSSDSHDTATVIKEILKNSK